MTGHALAKPAVPTALAARTPRLGRQCDQGHHVLAGGPCGMCAGSAGVMRQHGGRGVCASAIPLAALSVLRGPGVPLDPLLRNFMAPRFGRDFSAVPTGQATVPLAIARDDDPLEAAADRVAERALSGSIISGPAADLRRVRIHTDSLAAAAARSVGARAFSAVKAAYDTRRRAEMHHVGGSRGERM